jgi:hypothetical protein
MDSIQQVTSSISLEQVQGLFSEWRASHSKGSRIPEYLWNAAVRLCAEHSVGKVSKVLKLSWQSLRDKLVDFKPPRSSKPFSADQFLRVRVDDECFLNSSNQVIDRYVIQMARADGSQMKVLFQDRKLAMDICSWFLKGK